MDLAVHWLARRTVHKRLYWLASPSAEPLDANCREKTQNAESIPSSTASFLPLSEDTLAESRLRSEEAKELTVGVSPGIVLVVRIKTKPETTPVLGASVKESA